MVTECGMSCDCELSCGNRETQKGVTVELKIVRVENKGWGLFAAQFIPSGLFVCEYAGNFKLISLFRIIFVLNKYCAILF